jgi:ABC-type transport system involved in cytochrome c biogenesis permease subunit
MVRSTVFIACALLVAAIGWWAYQMFSAQILPEGVEPKGDPPVVSPVLLAYLSLAAMVVSLLSGVAGLVLKILDIRKRMAGS